ncbi:ABC transporter permease [Sporolactobacillus shoreae]|uniref:ABC transporter permease n=1 Tax=Sporolactobacillus shoreae TaxID=1465501 RepID=A0A4Z0GT24_9BACL|nr:ABC transporter permease [Sporolactobacillus shoreae]TGB00150.1 ABC transporter permease [Sporolactobacillus shoreae]
MREIVDVFLNTVKLNLRNRRALIFMILFPICLTLILGTALSNVGGNNMNESLHMKAAVVNQDHGIMAGQMEKFFQSKEIKKIVEMKTYQTLRAAESDLKSQKLDAIIIINRGFSQAAQQGSHHQLNFITSGDLESSVIKSIAESYLKRINAVQAAASVGALPEHTGNQVQSGSLISDHTLSINGKVPKSSDYYAVTMLIMIILYASNYGLDVVRESKKSPIGYRIRSLPVRQMNYLIGKTLGQLATVFLQIVILVTFFKFIYHANFGNQLGFIFLMCFLLGLIVILFSMALSLFFTCELADTLLNFIVPIATFLAGGYIKLSFLETNSITSTLRNWLPNSLAQNLIFQNIYGGSGVSTSEGILKLIFIAGCMLLLTAIAVRRSKNGDLSK